MGWMQMLCQTYDHNAAMAGKAVDDQAPLSLLAHMVANAQAEITIDESGVFHSTREVDKKESKTIIPVTEKSAGRTVGIEPHALCDVLSYIAGDFSTYLSDAKTADKCTKKFALYIEALEKWATSAYSHPKVRAIFAYLSGQTVTKDLIACGLLECNEDGTLAPKKLAGKPYDSALVRFRVLSADDTVPPATAEDPTLLDSYTKYFLSTQEGRRDICYLSGEQAIIANTHPKGVLAAHYNAKLISSNDSEGFTFRGRFLTSEEACAIGYEDTQKAHSALTWLAARQSVTTFGKKERRTYICWNPKGKPVPDNLDSPLFIDEDDEEARSNTREEYAKLLARTLAGYENKLDSDNDDIVIIGLDAATPGRLSITYYNELKASDFLARLHDWYCGCCWFFTGFTQEKKPFLSIKTPTIRQIVSYCLGTEQGNFMETSDGIMKEQSQRLIHCMLDKQRIPRDLLHAICCKASTPLAYSRGNRERIFSTACALIAKHYNEKGVNLNMALDYTQTDRSYLFGRLLAVAERAERGTYSRDEERPTNAIRLQAAFVQHPLYVWENIENALIPYYNHMKPGTVRYYKNIIGEIVDKLMEGEPATLNQPLEPLYLIGYYLQRAALNTFKKEEAATIKNEEETA